MKILYILYIGVSAFFYCSDTYAAKSIEQQLVEVGSVQQDEVLVVQRKFTRKNWRHEITPVAFGGIPFGNIRRPLFGSFSYTLHPNDWLGLELFNFVYSKTFFTGFVKDINDNNFASTDPGVDLRYQKLLYIINGGIQLSPFYGKMSTFSRYIAYLEPYLFLGAGFAKTDVDQYLAFIPGIGFRVFFREWVSMRLELRDFIYNERDIVGTGNGTTNWRHNWTVMVSLSFWLPKMPG